MYKNTAESIHDSYHRISALDNRTAEGRFGMLWSGFLLYVYIYIMAARKSNHTVMLPNTYMLLCEPWILNIPSLDMQLCHLSQTLNGICIASVIEYGEPFPSP